MKQEWVRLQNLQGKLLIGIQENYFSTSRDGTTLSLACPEPFISWFDDETKQEGFWQLEWFEDEEGDDLLILHEQETPEPLHYEFSDLSDFKFVISASGYYNFDARIANITGYGIRTDEDDYLMSIVLELGAEYILITSKVVMEIKVTDDPPEMPECLQLLFSTKME